MCAINDAEIYAQFAARVIETTLNEWNLPVVLVSERDGPLCFCADYQKLSTLICSHAYSLPRMEECTDSLGETSVLTTLDSCYGCCRIFGRRLQSR